MVAGVHTNDKEMQYLITNANLKHRFLSMHQSRTIHKFSQVLLWQIIYYK